MTSQKSLLLLLLARTLLLGTAFSTPSSSSSSSKPILIISPPGGVGETSAVSCAKRGAAVKWCVITPPSTSTSVVSLSEESLRGITDAGGSVDVVTSGAEGLLSDGDSSRAAVKVWGGAAAGVICTLDGSDGAEEVEDAVKVAVKEVCSAGKEYCVIVSPSVDKRTEGEEEGKRGGGLFGFLGGGNVPASMEEAVEGSRRVVSLKHGDLFGIPESSKDASPFMNGPRRSPILRDEYTLRSIRLTPTPLPQTRTSRLSLGDAAALLATSSLTDVTTVHLTSLPGVDRPGDDEWMTEFQRATEAGAAGAGSNILYETDLIVSDPSRMADWLATKWAPTVLRTYDIAGIRVGERPVYAARLDASDGVEIVWQTLGKNFESRTVGRMIIDVSEKGVTARRTVEGGVEVVKGFQGEDILVKSLGEAAAQAVQKGLAKKIKKSKPAKVVATPSPAVTSSAAAATRVTPAVPSMESGPRSAGARRSSQRVRGKRRKEETKGESPESWQ